MMWKYKEWYRFIMPIFLHADFLHLVMNLIAQVIIGSMMEKLLTLYRTGAIYLLAGIGGVIAGCLGNDAISVGASGAIFGLCGAFVLLPLSIGGMADIELGVVGL